MVAQGEKKEIINGNSFSLSHKRGCVKLFCFPELAETKKESNFFHFF